jgi:glucose-6-phosphate 1-epimerase
MNGGRSIAELNRRFGIPGLAEVVEGNGGLVKVNITSAETAAEMYLHGAHVTSWKPSDAEEVLFVSRQSHWENGRAIRAGVPICFPWFANKTDDPGAPAHGFVRTKAWQLESISREGNAVSVAMVTTDNEDTKKWWSADFRLGYRATFGSKLTLDLTLTNTGTSSLRFEEALHTYCRVASIKDARLQGLDAVRYLDKTDSNLEKTQRGDIVIGSETDRVYLNTVNTVELEDPGMRRRICIAKANSRTTIVWNPWIERAKAFSDFGDDEWSRMICIETSNVGDAAVTLPPGKEYWMSAILSVARM